MQINPVYSYDHREAAVIPMCPTLPIMLGVGSVPLNVALCVCVHSVDKRFLAPSSFLSCSVSGYPDPGWDGLRDGDAGGTPLPRRSDHRDLRGDQ